MLFITSPVFREPTPATPDNIDTAFALIQQLESPPDQRFVIVGRDEMTYAQTRWEGHGWAVEFQCGTLAEHYRLAELQSQSDAAHLLKDYLDEGGPDDLDAAWYTGHRIQHMPLDTITVPGGCDDATVEQTQEERGKGAAGQ